MAEAVDNLVLEQLRLIRESLGQVQGEMRAMRGDPVFNALWATERILS